MTHCISIGEITKILVLCGDTLLRNRFADGLLSKSSFFNENQVLHVDACLVSEVVQNEGESQKH